MQPATPFPAPRDLSRSYGKGWGWVKENKKYQSHSIILPLRP